jgi:Tfp pilus assembly protein PilZ
MILSLNEFQNIFLYHLHMIFKNLGKSFLNLKTDYSLSLEFLEAIEIINSHQSK